MSNVSLAGPCSFNPLPEVDTWVEKMAELASQKMSGPIRAAVWPYRVGDLEFLSVDMDGEAGGWLSLTFSTGAERCDYGIDDVECPDLTEALVMASLFVRAVDAKVSLSAGCFL